MHDVRQMIPRVHTDHMAIRNLPVINSLQSIPEENVGVLRLDSDSLRKGTDSSSLHGPLYAPLDKGVKDLHSRHLNLMNPKLDLGKSQITMISDIRSQMRSTTEIYSLPPDQMDNDSISTLEGQQYVSQTRMPAGNQQVAVDIHTTPESHYQCPTGSLSEAKTTVAENHRVIPIDQIDWHQYIQAVENNCGFGPKKLNQEDLDIWRHLVTNDRNMKSLIATAKSIEDFELISHHPQFSDLYSREKWAIIIQSLAHVAFMQRLSDIIENKKTSDGGSEASNSGIGDKEKRANRIFTRESYYRVRDEMESMSSGDEMTLQLDYYSHLPPPIESVHSSSSELSNQNAKTPEQQRMSPEQKITPKLQLSTSKVSNASNTFIRERSTSECFEHPPTLSVYVGNVSGRANASDPYQSGPMDYYGANGSSLGSFQSQINGNSANIRSAKELDKF